MTSKAFEELAAQILADHPTWADVVDAIRQQPDFLGSRAHGDRHRLRRLRVVEQQAAAGKPSLVPA